MKPETEREANAYIRRIRNPMKRQYAVDCLARRTMGDRTWPDGYSILGVMARQAVNMELTEIFARSGEPACYRYNEAGEEVRS